MTTVGNYIFSLLYPTINDPTTDSKFLSWVARFTQNVVAMFFGTEKKAKDNKDVQALKQSQSTYTHNSNL